MMMFIFFVALFAVVRATHEYQSPYYVSTGTSQQYRTQDDSGNYRFGYEESHPTGGTFRDETGDSWGNKYGSYGLQEADGRFRVVNYVADSQGFRAEIKSNEPGLAATKEPAATAVKKPILYSAPAAPVTTFSHSYNPEYPLLYHHHNPYYVPYGTYKGTPFRNYGPYYKGSPYTKKGAPLVTRHGYYIYP